jgi:hypothetical protein
MAETPGSATAGVRQPEMGGSWGDEALQSSLHVQVYFQCDSFYTHRYTNLASVASLDIKDEKTIIDICHLIDRGCYTENLLRTSP